MWCNRSATTWPPSIAISTDSSPACGRRVGTPTPAPGWAIRDQISHLWFFDQRAVMALTDPDGVRRRHRSGCWPTAAPMHRSSRAERSSRRSFSRAGAPTDRSCSTLASTARSAHAVPWYGPAMAARSFITARLMETWAHGQDVADALGVARAPTERLRHVAHIGVRARPFSYAIHGLTVPDGRRGRAADRARTATSGSGATSEHRLGHRSGARLLPGGDPAPSRRRHRLDDRRRCRHGVDAHRPGVRRRRRRRAGSRASSPLQIGDQLEDLGGGVAVRLAELGQPGADAAAERGRADRRRRPSSWSRTGCRGPRARRACARRTPVVAADVLDVVGLRRPRTAAARSGRWWREPVLGEEVRIAGGDDRRRTPASRRGDDRDAAGSASTGRGRARPRAAARG